MRVRIRQNFKGERMQRITRQNRGCLVKRLMDGRLAAPHVVIIHCGKIVVDQRIDMDALDRGTRPTDRIAIDVEQTPGREHKQRAQAFAATNRGMAHRAVQIRARIFRDRQKLIETPIDIGTDFGQGRGKRQGRSGHALNPLQRAACQRHAPRYRCGSLRSGPGLR
ncbi:hypothetical protein D9M73_119460 [compost metagenome]